MLLVDSQKLRYLSPTTWKDVLAVWRANEANNPVWIEHYTSRGYASWEEWRAATHEGIHGETLEWHMYDIIDPLQTVPTLHGGPFTSWQRVHYGGAASRTFSELAQQPAIAATEKISDLRRNFPSHTTITGLVVDQDVYVIEGMHRCCALALDAQATHEIKTDLKIILAQFPNKELPELGTAGK